MRRTSISDRRKPTPNRSRRIGSRAAQISLLGWLFHISCQHLISKSSLFVVSFGSTCRFGRRPTRITDPGRRRRDSDTAGGSCSILFMTRFGSISGEDDDDQRQHQNKKNVAPNKGALYSNDVLEELWCIHQALAGEQPSPAVPPSTGDMLGLHDLVKQMVEKPNDVIDSVDNDLPDKDEQFLRAWVNRLLLSNDRVNWPERLQDIRVIASDVDGTLLSSRHDLHPRTVRAIVLAVESAHSPTHPLQCFFPATGKSRAGALTSLGPEIGPLLSGVPGVFIQGLYCVDADGQVIFEKKLVDPDQVIVTQVEQLARQHHVSMFGYDGDRLWASADSHDRHIRQVHEKWGEPTPQVVESSMANYEPGFHKVLLLDDDPHKIQELRPYMEALALEHDCVVTQAVPTMLELLPAGCSKAVGVSHLCAHLGWDPTTQLLALGDAENDVGMLLMAAVGVAVGNASPVAQAAADLVLSETNDEGGAGLAIQGLGLGNFLDR